MKSVIGIFAHNRKTTDKVDASCLNRPYSDAVIENGGLPLIIPYTDNISVVHGLIDACSGVIIPGGDDIAPSLYGEAPHEMLGCTDMLLDRMELDVLDYCKEKDIPVLGICRGLQLMNVHASGTLWQDIPSQCPGGICHRQKDARNTPTHSIRISEHSVLSTLISDKAMVNSLHHQGIRILGNGYSAVAVSDDGMIEAIEHDNGIWFAVQWHPELLSRNVPEMNKLFGHFIRLCSERNNK